jgi:autotransporter translocation and assembly factor TamB
MPEAIELEGVRIDLRRGLDGRWNLPVGRGEPAPVLAGPPTLPLRTSLRDVGITVSDRVSGLEAEVGGIFLEATGSRLETTGTLDIKDPLAWRVGSQSGEVAFTPAAFRLDRAFTLTGWTARTPEATVRLEGTWSDVFASGSLGLTFDADLDLRRLAARSATPLPIDGSLHLDGQISVARGEPRAEFRWRGDEVRAAGRRMRTAGHATITGKGLEVSAASLKVAGGSLDGSGRVLFGTSEASRIDARWSGLDLASLLMPSGPRAESSPLRGLVAGHLRASWPGLAWPKANAQMVLEARPGGTDGPRGLPIEGDARLDLRGGRWNLEMRAHSREDAQIAGQFEGALGASTFADTTLAGRLDLEILDMSPLMAMLGLEPVAGQGRGSVLASGTLASPRAAVEVRGVGLRVRESPPVHLSAQGTIDRTSVVVSVADLHAGSAHAQATGRLLFESGGLDGRYEFDLPDLGAFPSAVPAGFDPRGALHGRGTLGGTSTEPQASLSATGTDLRLAGQTAETARFELRLDGPWLRVDSFELGQATGKLSATGAYDRRRRAFSLGVQGRNFEIRPLPKRLAGPEAVPFGGRVEVDFEGGGSVAAPEGRGRVTLSDGRWEGRSLGPFAADLDLSKKGLSIDLRADDLSARVEGTVELRAPHAFSIMSRFERSDLGTAAKLLGLEASLSSGTASLSLQAKGSFDDPGQATGSLTLDEVDGMIRGRAVRLHQTASVEVGPDRVRVDRLDLGVGAARLRVDGALDAQAQGDPGSIRPGALCARVVQCRRRALFRNGGVDCAGRATPRVPPGRSSESRAFACGVTRARRSFG